VEKGEIETGEKQGTGCREDAEGRRKSKMGSVHPDAAGETGESAGLSGQICLQNGDEQPSDHSSGEEEGEVQVLRQSR